MKRPFNRPRGVPKAASDAKLSKRRNQGEHVHQSAFVKLCALHEHRFPALKYLFAVPNFARLRSQREVAARLREGLKKGVPDLWLPYPSQGHPGLIIENKFGKNKPTPEQLEWIERMRAVNWRVVVCYSFEQQVATLLDYLQDPDLERAIGQFACAD